MPNIDEYELEVASACEKGRLKSVATKRDLAKFKAAARATAIKDRRVNIRLSEQLKRSAKQRSDPTPKRRKASAS